MDEKEAFNQRLLSAFKRARIETNSPTRLATAFNLRHAGEPVSTQAVHKWLSGKTIPGQDKIRTLAQWLEVSPEWLRYGETIEKVPRAAAQKRPVVVTEESIGDVFKHLSSDHKKIVCNLIATLLEIERQR